MKSLGIGNEDGARRTSSAADASSPTVQVQVSPAYDMLYSFDALISGAGHNTRWREWVRTTGDALTVARQRTVQRYSVASAFVSLIPTLGESHALEHLPARLAAMPLPDFLRVAVTMGFVAPDTPLDAATLVALSGDSPRARAFVARYLRLTPRQRSSVLHLLADPTTVQRELAETLAWFAAGPFAALELQLGEERARAGERLRDLVAAQPTGWAAWLVQRSLLMPAETFAGFSPVVLAPAAFICQGRATYYHEVQHALFDGTDYEPFILALSANAVLAPAPLHALGRRSRSGADALGVPAPEERYATLFAALADPSRLRLVRLLAARPHYGQELAAALGMSAATVSHHIAMLMKAHLVTIERQAHRTYYVLHTDDLSALLREGERYTLSQPEAPADAQPTSRGQE